MLCSHNLEILNNFEQRTSHLGTRFPSNYVASPEHITWSLDAEFFVSFFCCCSSVAQSCLTLCNPVDCSMPGFSVLHYLLKFAQTYVHWVGDAIQPSHPLLTLLLLPSIFPSIRVFSKESALLIRWPKYWNFSFNMSPSNEYSGMIFFRMDWLDQEIPRDLSKGLSRVFSNTTVQKHQFFGAQLSL